MAEREEDKMLKLYMAALSKSDLSALDNKHVTLSFSDTKATEKLSFNDLMGFFPCQGYVKDVVYWERADVTVALLNVENILEAQNYCASVGFDYDLEFIPHITLGRGDLVSESRDVIWRSLELVDCYIRLKDFN